MAQRWLRDSQIAVKNIYWRIDTFKYSFFFIKLLNGTNWITPYIIQNPTVFFRIHH